ncbi:MAG: hypothetical protein HRT44_09125 [Bdellovibrionales bacterium]|nr:hypothetical protein [Bdellovibrionales bacterium]
MKFYLLLVPLFILAFSTFELKPTLSLKEKIFNPPPKNLKNFSFGYDDLLASLFWVRVLQDIEVCDKPLSDEKPGLFEKGEKVSQILNRQVHKAQCEKAWVYQMLDVITDMNPDFYMAYLAGGNFLSVLVDDRLGAHELYTKGLKYYPEKWQLLYQAAYHELFEMQNAKASAELLKRAGDRGAPAWVFSLSARLYSEVGQALFAKKILEDIIRRKPDAEGIDRVRALQL